MVLFQDILPGLRAAAEQGHDFKACALQWMYCHLLLLLGGQQGYRVPVSAFLAHAKRVGDKVLTRHS